MQLNRGGVDPVVFGMGADETDEDDAGVVLDFHDESVVIAFDVKNDAIVRKDVRGWIGLLDACVRPDCL